MTRLPDISYDEQGRPVLTMRPRDRLLEAQPQPQQIGVPLINAPGSFGALGEYPQPLAEARQFFDQPAGTRQLWQDNPAWPMRMLGGLLPVKVNQQGQESLAIPGAVRQAAQTGLDVLASPYTGGLPQNFVADVATNAIGPEMDLGKPSVFAGVRAQQFPKELAAISERLIKSGVEPQVAWRETGVGRDKMSGKNPFFEISDDTADYRPGGAANDIAARAAGVDEGPAYEALRRQLIEGGYTAKLSEVLHHPELYANYPELADYPVRISPRSETAIPIAGQGSYVGAFNPGQKSFDIAGAHAADLNAGKSTLLHEIQHAVQGIEDWPKGGNLAGMQNAAEYGQWASQVLRTREMVKSFPGKTMAEKAQAAQAQFPQLATPQAQASSVWLAAIDETNPKYTSKFLKPYARVAKIGAKFPAEKRPFRLYQRLAGEAQSRATEGRMTWNPQERLNEMPQETLRRYGDPGGEPRQLISVNTQGYVTGSEPQGQLAPEPGRNPFFEFGTPKPGGRAFPDEPQVPIERYRGKGPSERMGELIADRRAINRFKGYVEKGIPRGGLIWYPSSEQVRRAFESKKYGLGESRGGDEYRQMVKFIGSTSPMSDVLSNIRNASFYRELADKVARGQVENMPQPVFDEAARVWHGETVPEPYGAVAQALHQQNVNRLLASIGYDPKLHPKPPSFEAGLIGNKLPVAVDTHNFRLQGIVSGNPAFLTAEARRRGITPKTAKPTDWQGKPGAAEYAPGEEMQQELAARMGLDPADLQGSAWVGGAEKTGLVTDYNQSFSDLYNQIIQRSAQRFEMTPEDMLRAHIRQRHRLVAKTNPIGPAQVIDPHDPLERNRLLQMMGSQS